MSTTAELQTQLDAVNTAITNIMTNGQKSGHDGKFLEQPTLDALFKERARLESEITRSDTNHVTRTVAEY